MTVFSIEFNAKIESYKDLEKRLNAKISEQDKQISIHKAKVANYDGDAVQAAINSQNAKIKSVVNLYRNLLDNYKLTLRQKALQSELEKTKKLQI